MFTRFKALTMFLIFCVSFILGTIFLGTDGILARRWLLEEKKQVEETLFEKEAKLENLRDRNAGKTSESVYGKDLVYSFGDNTIYEPEKEEVKAPVKNTFPGYSSFRILLVSLIPTGIYFVIITLLWLKKDFSEAKEEEKERKKIDRYND